MTSYIPVFVVLVFSILVGGGMWLMGSIFGPQVKSEVKNSPFECGNESFGTRGKRFGVKYYMIAMIFLVFDLEAVFVYPWAVLYRKLGVPGLIEMVIFLGILTVGLIYVWKKGALEWE